MADLTLGLRVTLDEALKKLVDGGITQGFADVLAERGRQICQYSAGHDDDHLYGELAQAAVGLTCGALALIDLPGNRAYWAGNAAAFWPDGWAELRAKGTRQDLVRAAALLIAEIERLDRRENQAQVPPPAES